MALVRAQLDQADLNLSWTKVVAPKDGWVTKRDIEQGNYVQAGQSVLSLVTPDIWVTANFKEVAARSHAAGAAGGYQGGCLSAAQAQGPRGQHSARLRLALHRIPPENATGNS